MAGRKTLLTPEIIEEASKYLNSGCFEKYVYVSMGIAERTWFSWKEKGQVIETMLENEVYQESNLDGNDKLYLQFTQMCGRARAKTINLNVLLIQKHAKKNWRVAKWCLEILDPARFMPSSIAYAKEHSPMKHTEGLGSSLLDRFSEEEIERFTEEEKQVKEELDRIFGRAPRDHPPKEDNPDRPRDTKPDN